MLRAALLLAFCLGGAASAHDADIVFVRVERQGDVVREVATMTGPTLAALAPIDADGDGLVSQADLDARTAAIDAGVWASMPLEAGGAPCERKTSSATLRQTFVELAAEFRCPPGPIRQTYDILGVLPSNYRVVIGTFGGENRSHAFAQGNERTLILGDEGGGDHKEGRGLAGWIWLGILHIADVRRALDHLAFLVGVLLVGGSWRRVLLLVTAFTLAHSITLGVTALGIVPLGEVATRWVEALIAFSIVFIGAENLWPQKGAGGREVSAREWLSDLRLWVVFVFGLIHGFGFASVLRDYGLGDQVAVGLLGFNLGVELGQALIVTILFPIVRLLERRPALYARVVRVISVLIVAAGGYWLTERLMG